MTDVPDPPSRRSSATVRSLVLRAARELFAERGYEQVGTREIAVRAGVTQALVFRHFGTKANLFTEAVFQPFYDFVASYLRRWADQGHGSTGAGRGQRGGRRPGFPESAYISGVCLPATDGGNLARTSIIFPGDLGGAAGVLPDALAQHIS